MGLATKQQILESCDWDFDEFDVEKWGRVRIRALSAKERLDLVGEFGSGGLSNDQAAGFFCKLIALAVVDEANRQVFDMNGDIEKLKSRNWNRLQFVADRIMEFNGMNKTSGDAKN